MESWGGIRVPDLSMLDTETKRRIDTARDILVGKVPDPKSQVEQITIALIYKFMDDIDAESAVIDPKKDQTVLDPACGTAGFLISSYKHILKTNTDAEGHSTLTPDEKGTLAANFRGYDISPDMVRLSLVNLYLHGFVEPHIAEYDTLTSEERWNEYADVILANPPFMSPKGGIRPHSRFSVQSKRSEVLFVDYIAKHLTPAGRAGVIVPEGIIFQSQRAHKQLRKLLVENYLVAVVSLPAGVFQPYSGVKTSILILDRSLATKADHIAFFKVENDGFDLGAQRRAIVENDLPQVRAELGEYLRRLHTGESVADFALTLGLVSKKEKVAEGGEYNLSGERYRETEAHKYSKWPMVKLQDVCDAILSGGTPSTKNEEYWKGDIPWITSADIVDLKTAKPRKYITEKAIKESTTNLIKKGNIIVVTRVGLGKLFRNDFDVCISQDSQGLILNGAVNADYLVYILKDRVKNFKKVSQGSTIQGVTKGQLSEIQIPLPPLEVQQEIVAEIEGYQRVIDGARAVVENWQPQIAVESEWPLVAIGDVCDSILSGGTPSTKNEEYWKGDIPWITSANIVNIKAAQPRKYITDKAIRESATNLIPRGNIIVVTRVGLGKLFKNEFDVCISQDSQGLIIKTGINADYLVYILRDRVANFKNVSQGSTIQGVTKKQLSELQIPLPPLETQQAIVAEIEAEQALVDGNRALIERFERKIRDAVGRVWGAGGTVLGTTKVEND